MMLIPTRIRPSDIHGLGVFAVENIPEGTVVWRYNPRIDYRVILEQHEELEKYRNHGYRPHGMDYVEFPGDAALFINHCRKANIRKTGDEAVAVRVILEGEEILADYREYDSELEGFE